MQLDLDNNRAGILDRVRRVMARFIMICWSCALSPAMASIPPSCLTASSMRAGKETRSSETVSVTSALTSNGVRLMSRRRPNARISLIRSRARSALFAGCRQHGARGPCWIPHTLPSLRHAPECPRGCC